MARVRNLIQFVVYWFLTYIFGMFCFGYYILCCQLRRPKEQDKEKGKEMQPSCLSDPVYGNHKYFKSQGVKIHYVESGPRDAKVVLLIHGIPGFWFCWRKQIPVLTDYFRVIALDLRGCGDSESPNQRGIYSKEIIIQDILHLMDSLGCSTLNLICCETSGYLGWELASKYPHRISKLAFINSPHPSVLHYLFHTKPYYYFKHWYLLFLQIPFLPEAITSGDQTSGWLQSLLEPQKKAKAILEEEIKAYQYTFSRRDDWQGVINHLRQIELRPLIETMQSSVITTPTMMLMGTSHPYLTVESAYRSAELAERIKIRVIANAGNNLQVTHAGKTNEELLNFLVDQTDINSSISRNEVAKPSLVGRVFGAVKSPYAISNSDVTSLSNGIKEAAQSTLYNGVNFASTVLNRNSKLNGTKLTGIAT